MSKIFESAATPYLSLALFLGKPIAQGMTGQAMYEISETAYSHWNSRTENVLRMIEDEFSYDSMPITPKRIFQVKLKLIGSIDPLPYSNFD